VIIGFVDWGKKGIVRCCWSERWEKVK